MNTARREQLIDQWAARLRDWGLMPIAPGLLQILGPLGFIGSQAILVGQPLLTLFASEQALVEFSSLLDDPDALSQIERCLTEAEQRAS